ncbi:20628_t:CDS:2 [Gigaspora margarita]|uniref:20628_t:CDS:1 n=1 Tax=Gigaspora margarita TaxID=4874 RepID=A0ABN7UK31_GIGMA|nr:20628_t:CDS:2 [Gigaspora margarita]
MLCILRTTLISRAIRTLPEYHADFSEFEYNNWREIGFELSECSMRQNQYYLKLQKPTDLKAGYGWT